MDDTLTSTLELAADWADRFAELTTDERRQLALWLEESPENAAAFARMRRLMSDTALIDAFDKGDAPVQPLAPLPELRAGSSRPARADRRKPMLGRRQAIAAGLAGALALPFAGYWLAGGQTAGSPPPLRFASRVGERRRFTLPDGSGLLLDAASRVAVDFSEGRRHVLLEQGAARFDVRHDPARPFKVRTPHAGMVALGTSFSVDHLAEASELRVFSGRVRLDVADQETRVVPADRWALVHGATVSTGSFDPTTHPDWQSDWLDADAMPLGFAVQRLARYSAAPVRIADPKLASLTFSGRFRLDNPRQSLELIGALFGLRLEKRKDALYLA
ncbi:FecR domain-containing protein [Novosphingobium sp. BL-8A]|uniref:FecR family protein n=1 Tax=Novosphingobium sp. BL-8A TaxID=3127639 RepID=UPI003757F302